jgi:hypothetical protein
MPTFVGLSVKKSEKKKKKKKKKPRPKGAVLVLTSRPYVGSGSTA